MKLLRYLLFPFAVLYDLITRSRNFLYDIGVLKSISFDIPVIAVGNLSVGGTGKTPFIEYLVSKYLKENKKIAILSRGYKRKTKGFILLNDTHTALDVGDEPLQFFKKFGKQISIAVDAKRVNGIKQLLKLKSFDIILLDDAFQHRSVKASTYILLTKYQDLYTNDYLLPTGNLREHKNGAKRADIIVVSKCPSDLSKQEQNRIQSELNLKANQKLLFSTITYDNELKGGNPLHIEKLKHKEIILVTGIANPSPLIIYLKSKHIKIKHLNYPDHYFFSNKDIKNINQLSKNHIILTTEKDFVRLYPNVHNLYYISIKIKFLK